MFVEHRLYHHGPTAYLLEHYDNEFNVLYNASYVAANILVEALLVRAHVRSIFSMELIPASSIVALLSGPTKSGLSPSPRSSIWHPQVSLTIHEPKTTTYMLEVMSCLFLYQIIKTSLSQSTALHFAAAYFLVTFSGPLQPCRIPMPLNLPQ